MLGDPKVETVFPARLKSVDVQDLAVAAALSRRTPTTPVGPVGFEMRSAVLSRDLLFVNEPVSRSSLKSARLRPIHLLTGPTLRKQALL